MWCLFWQAKQQELVVEVTKILCIYFFSSFWPSVWWAKAQRWSGMKYMTSEHDWQISEFFFGGNRVTLAHLLQSRSVQNWRMNGGQNGVYLTHSQNFNFSQLPSTNLQSGSFGPPFFQAYQMPLIRLYSKPHVLQTTKWCSYFLRWEKLAFYVLLAPFQSTLGPNHPSF